MAKRSVKTEAAPAVKQILIVSLFDGSKAKEFDSIQAAFDYGSWLALNMHRKPKIEKRVEVVKT